MHRGNLIYRVSAPFNTHPPLSILDYKKLCETEGSNIPLFLQYWWMETVCEGKRWDVLFAYDKQGAVTGALPYLIGSKLGFRYVLQPQLTQYNGPWFRYPHRNMDALKRAHFEEEVMEQLLDGLKHLHLTYYQQNCAPEFTNWLPYYWRGFRQTTRYTYRIEDISNPEAVFAEFRRKDRQKMVEKTMPLLHRVDISPTEFAQLHHRYWKSKGEKDVLSKDLIERVCRTAIQRGQGLLLGLADEEGRLAGATFAPFDDRCAYALLGALSPECQLRGVSECLFWTLVQELSGKTQSFDFEGSMDKDIGYFYRSFGAVQKSYFSISKWMV